MKRFLRASIISAVAIILSLQGQAAGFDKENDPFIIGMFGVSHWNEETFTWLTSLGINYVHSYSLWRASDLKAPLDLATKHGMKVMYDLGGHIHLGKNNDPEWEKNISARLQVLKDHPAIGIWQVWDEPKTEMLPKVRKLNALVKSMTNQPTELVMNERTEYWDSRGYTDIWGIDNYPVRGVAFPDENLQWHSRVMRNAATGYNYKGTPFFVVAQACDFSCFKYNIKDPARLANLRYPNLNEMRFMLFSDLCYAVRGIWFFSEAHCHRERPQGRAFVQETLTPAVRELREFLELVPRPWQPALRDSKKIDQAYQVSFASFESKSGSVVILVNDSGKTCPLHVDLSAFEHRPKEGELRPWAFTRGDCGATYKNGLLHVPSAAPWEVFVWTIAK